LRGQKSPLLLETSRMIKEQDIRKLIDEHLEGTDKFLVELKVKAGNNILVFIDGDHDVLLQDCIDLSRHIESNLDRDEEDFSLNVSSHGLDQPLRMFRQYPKNVGRVLNIIMEDGSRKKGKLLKAEKEGLTIMPSVTKNKKKTKKDITEEYISFDHVKETKVVATFKKQ
jgi:ribosome maturation factor RimP